MAFQKQQQQIELMDRPFIVQVQYLLNKLTENPSLNSNDVALLDKAQTTTLSSEMANSVNQIFMVISQSPIKQFWESLSAVISYSHEDRTRLMLFSMLSNRIRKEWHSYDASIHQGLKLYVIQNINKYLEQDSSQLLSIMNQILVGILRFQWNTLFKDFVSSLESQGANLPTSKLMNNLSILRLLLEEGFATKQQLTSPSQSEQFRNSLAHDMRGILRVLCLYLQSDSINRNQVVNKCLQTLRCSIQYIPAFEIFNCNLIQILAGLIVIPQFHRSLATCLEEIFRFRECSTFNNNHSKIVKKLLLVLQVYLDRFENTKRYDYNEMDNLSTEESFKSGKTKVKRQRNTYQYYDLLNLVYEFLIRYVPFMDKARGEEDLDIQYETNIKIYFSQDLYESFSLIYWRLLYFLQTVLDRLDPFLDNSNDDQGSQEKRKAICCVRLMITMLTKLKINARPQIQAAIQTTILNFTPLSPQFVPYYLQFDLLQIGLETATYPPFFSTQIQEEYIEFIRAILKQNSISQLYFQIIERRTEDNQICAINENDRLGMNMEAMQSKQLQRYSILKTINSINRVCWSAVYAYKTNYQATMKLPISKIVITLTKSAQLYKQVLIQKCYSLNSKFIAQIYYPNSKLYAPLFSTLQITKNESVAEFVLLLFSKIFLSESVNCNLESQGLKVIVSKLHEVEALDVTGQSLIQLYPAFINFLIRKMEQLTDKQRSNCNFKEVLQMLIKTEIDSFGQFSKIASTMDHIDLQRSILLFKKIKEIVKHLSCMFKHTKVIKSSKSVVNWLSSNIKCVIANFQFKNKLFCDQIKEIKHENFDIFHLLQFRKYYVQVIRSLIIVNAISTSNNESKQLKPNSKPKKQSIQLIKRAQQSLRSDFVTQQQFKVKQFLQFQANFYQWIISSQPEAAEDLINQSLSQILLCLQNWSGDYEMVLQKYKFLKEVVRIFGLRLSKNNRSLLMTIFQQLSHTNIQFNGLQLIVEIFQLFMAILTQDSIKCQRDSHCDQFTSIFLMTFQKLFNPFCRSQTIFQKLGHLFFMEIETIKYIALPLDPNKKDKTDVIYTVLQKHILDKVNVQLDEENCFRLKRVFRQRNFSRWIIDLKECVVYIHKKSFKTY